ncbi:NuoM family protein [Desulfuromonas sp. TF]|uniref:complex I subunit 4 family protein n=1 Tax=Desulfuromonas sp. TF TaxID=1232410 RepID=UPI0003F90694|nr:NADH-quinone oxidoreductase subunit M [Desulfuromonas sp. TF]
MNLDSFPWLSSLIVLPMAAAALCLLLRHHPRVSRWIALVTTLAILVTAVGLFVTGGGQGGWLRYEDHPWIIPFGIRYTLGLDGISLLLVLLTALTQLLAIVISWRRKYQVAIFFSMLLFMEGGIMGVFLALDLFLFYLFWEVMLIPMFFLIGVWGHERRVYAAVKFFIFTMAGSLLMLLAIIALYLLHGQQTGEYTFALAALQQTDIPGAIEPWLYAAFLLAFVVKVPLVPLHTWLPDAHTEAPTAGSLDLAGLLLKTGLYGLIRIAFPLFPEMAQASFPLLAVLALTGIFYAAWIAYAQHDLKRLIAYSSVAHVGFMVLGFCAWDAIAMEGSVLQMFNHGITTGALFIMAGMIQHRAETRDLGQLGGLWGRVPILSFFFLFFSLASLGLPGLNNFAGEILILLGVFRVNPLWGALALGGVVFAAAYMLRAVQGVIWGPPGPMKHAECWVDLEPREMLVLVPLALLVLWLGLYPEPFLAPIREPVQRLLGGTSLLALKGGMP